MTTSRVALDQTQYVRANFGKNKVRLQSHLEAVRVILSENQPLVDTPIFHLMQERDGIVDFGAIDSNVWALATTDNCGMTITENVSDSHDANRTAFGESTVATLSPLAQVSAQYGLLTDVLTITDSNESGTADIQDGKFTVNTGTSSTGLATILTKRNLSYRAGQGLLTRLTGLFDTPVVDTLQGVGLVTAENSFVFAYAGETFGILHAHGGIDELQELTLTSAATTVENATVTIDDIDYIVPLTIDTADHNAYEIALSLNAQVPNFSFSANANMVVAQATIPRPVGVFAYSSATSVGEWVEILAGVGPINDFIPQTEWNTDTRISTDPLTNLNPQFGNVYQIRYKFLGFGSVRFYVEDANTGDFVLVHRIKYANTVVDTNVTNPSFRAGWFVNNLGNNTNLQVQGASVASFIEGVNKKLAPPRAVSVDQSDIGDDLTNLISIRNRLTFGGKVNRAELFPILTTGSTQAVKVAFFKVIINPTYSEPVTFAYVDRVNSIAEVTNDKVFITGGAEIGTITVVQGAPQQVRFNEGDAETYVNPGDTICIAAVIPAGSSNDCQASLTFIEDL